MDNDSETEYLKNIAIIGASGNLGKPTLDALVKRGQHNITIITRPSSTATFPQSSNVTVKTGDYGDQAFMISTLHSQEALIIILGFAGLASQDTIFQAAAKAGVKYIIPSEYGQDSSNPKTCETVPMLKMWNAAHVSIEELGMKWIAAVNGLWLNYVLENNLAGVNVRERKATVYTDSEIFCTTTLAKVGEGIAAMLALPIAVIEKNFVNGHLYLSSFRLTHEELFRAILSATGTLESEWTTEKKAPMQLLEEGKEKLRAGDRMAIMDLIYGATFTPGFGGDFGDKVRNEMLGLEEEDLEEVVRGVVGKIAASKGF